MTTPVNSEEVLLIDLVAVWQQGWLKALSVSEQASLSLVRVVHLEFCINDKPS